MTQAGLAIDSSGNVYGTTATAGANGYGVVFRLTPRGSFTTPYAFAGGSDGRHPRAAPVLDSSGNLYGTTALGGGSGCNGGGCGTMYKVTPAGVETILHAFSETEGADSESSLVADSKGYLYGTTKYAGKYGFGTVFKVKE